MLRSPVIWLFALMFFGFGIISWGLISWVPSYLILERHQSLVATGILSSIPWFCTAAAVFIGGFVFDRYFYRRQRWLIVPCMCVTAVFLGLMLWAPSTAAFVTFTSIAMFVMYLVFMPMFGLPVRMLPSSVVGAATGMINLGGQAGGAIAPLVMGILADHLGFGAAFAFLLCGAGATVVAVLLLPGDHRGFQRALEPLLGASAGR
jgi:sugar phosphate permease